MGNPKPRFGGIFRALRHRNYRLFISGQLVSLIGTWMQSIAQSWLVYRLTGSSTLLGVVGFCNQIPVFLLAPIGGAIADRVNRHHVVIATQTSFMVLAFTMATLDLTGLIQVWHILVVALLLGITSAFDIPARQAFISQMVPKEDLMNAIALNSSMFNSARILGPSVAGILISVVGEGWCFFGDGVSYIAVIAALLMMRVEPRQPVHGRSAVADILEGFRFALDTPPIYAVLMLLGVVSMIGMPYTVLMPVFADRILHSGARGLGLLMGATGAGALIGALALAAKKEVKGLGKWISIACGCFGCSLILFTLSRHLLLSMLLLVPVGFSMMVQMASSNTLVQSMSPDVLRGRVMSLYSMMFMGMAPIGALLAGFAAGRIGAPATVAIGGVIAIAGALLFRWKWPAYRQQARRLIIAQQMQPGEPPDEVTAGGTHAIDGGE